VVIDVENLSDAERSATLKEFMESCDWIFSRENGESHALWTAECRTLVSADRWRELVVCGSDFTFEEIAEYVFVGGGQLHKRHLFETLFEPFRKHIEALPIFVHRGWDARYQAFAYGLSLRFPLVSVARLPLDELKPAFVVAANNTALSLDEVMEITATGVDGDILSSLSESVNA
jgi:hypothetical protein